MVTPPRVDAVLSDIAEPHPTGPLHAMAWQRANGNNQRTGVESQMARKKGVLGDTLRFHPDPAQATEVAIGVAVLNRMLDLGRPDSVRVA